MQGGCSFRLPGSARALGTALWPAGLPAPGAPQPPEGRERDPRGRSRPSPTTPGPSGRAVESGGAGAGVPAAEGHRPFPGFPGTAGAP